MEGLHVGGSLVIRPTYTYSAPSLSPLFAEKLMVATVTTNVHYFVPPPLSKS